MSDEINAGAVPSAAVAPPAPAAAPPAAGPVTTDLPPEALKARLEREAAHARAETLKALGFATEDEAKAAAAELAKRREDAKTDTVRAAEAVEARKAAEAEAAKLRSAVAEMAGRMMVGLTDEQRAAVMDLAGEDAAQQIRAVQTLQPLWAKGAASAVAAPAPKVAPASTITAGAQPADGANAPTNHRAVYEATRDRNPFAAASYGLQHPDVYAPKQ